MLAMGSERGKLKYNLFQIYINHIILIVCSDINCSIISLLSFLISSLLFCQSLFLFLDSLSLKERCISIILYGS